MVALGSAAARVIGAARTPSTASEAAARPRDLMLIMGMALQLDSIWHNVAEPLEVA